MDRNDPWEFESEEERQEADELLAMIDACLEAIPKPSGDERITVMNLDGVVKFNLVHEVLRQLFKNSDVKITNTLHHGKSYATITVRGKSVRILHPEVFARVARLASNFEITPLVDGSVEIGFMFYGLKQDLTEKAILEFSNPMSNEDRIQMQDEMMEHTPSLNLIKSMRFNLSHYILKKMFKGCDVAITPPTVSANLTTEGKIEVPGKEILVKRPRDFSAAVDCSDRFFVKPVDDSICVTFEFKK